METTGRPRKGYRSLIAWQRAFQLADLCCELADRLPRRETFALANQLRRSALSVSSNIAEGNGRLTLGDYIHHLKIAHGSLMELDQQLLLAERRRYLSTECVNEALTLCDETGRLIFGLLRSLESLKVRRASLRRRAESGEDRR